MHRSGGNPQFTMHKLQFTIVVVVVGMSQKRGEI